MKNKFDLTKNGAIFSKDGLHRFALWRVWDPNKPMVMFIGLNPSNADAENDDPTIRRVTRFAKDWGYGTVIMVNLFSQVTPNPKELDHNVSPYFDSFYIGYFSTLVQEVVFAWGSFKEAKERAETLIRNFDNPKALHINADGSPKHPLYIRADAFRFFYAKKMEDFVGKYAHWNLSNRSMCGRIVEVKDPLHKNINDVGRGFWISLNNDNVTDLYLREIEIIKITESC